MADAVAGVVLDCPHCGAQKMNFKYGGEMMARHGSHPTWLVLFMCRHCLKGIVASLWDKGHGRSPREHDRDLLNHFGLLSIHPYRLESKIPEHLPDPIAKEFLEGVNSLQREALPVPAWFSEKCYCAPRLHLQRARPTLPRERL